jgi:uncharacterized membrane protein YbhN (UPF0104 family)
MRGVERPSATTDRRGPSLPLIGAALAAVAAGWAALGSGLVSLPATVGLRTLAGLFALAFAAIARGGLALGVVLSALGVGGRSPVRATLPLAVLVVAVGIVCWRRRDRVAAGIAAAVVPPARSLARLHLRLDAPTRSAVAERIEGLFEAVERVAADPRRLAVAVGFAALGQELTAACLWVALTAVGAPVSFLLLSGVLPLASVGTLVPSPGGAAGVEAALIGLLISVAGVAVPSASAAVFLYRTATFWAPLPLCGLLAVGFGDRAPLQAAI